MNAFMLYDVTVKGSDIWRAAIFLYVKKAYFLSTLINIVSPSLIMRQL